MREAFPLLTNINKTVHDIEFGGGRGGYTRFD